MAAISGSNPRIVYNGVDLTDHFRPEVLNATIQSVLVDVLKESVQEEIRHAFDINLDLTFTFVRVRPAVRQSCLWRHSFDWRNRKRGHPLHREYPRG